MIIDSHAHYSNHCYKKLFRYLTRNAGGYAPCRRCPGVSLQSCGRCCSSARNMVAPDCVLIRNEHHEKLLKLKMHFATINPRGDFVDERLYPMIFKRKSFHLFKETGTISEDELAQIEKASSPVAFFLL